MLSFFAPLASDFFQILAEMPGFALCRYAIVPESAAAVKRTVSELKKSRINYRKSRKIFDV